MRKVIPIFLIAMLLLNVLGYYGVFVGLQYHVSRNLTKRLDTDLYSQQETFTLKMPMSVPYHVDTDEYERVDGEIEYKGEFYRLVKQKLSKDTLYIVCLKDNESKHIKQALNDYIKTFSDKPADNKQNAKSFFNFIKDYLPTKIAVSSSTAGWSYSSPYYWMNDLTKSLHQSITSPPPKA